MFIEIYAQDLKLGLPRGHYGWSSIMSANFSYDGKDVVTSSNYNDTYCWNAETGKNYFQLFGHNSCAHEAIFSHDGKYIATRSCDGKVILWDKNTGEFIKQLQTKVPVTFFVFSPDDRYILSSFGYNSLVLWNLSTGKIDRLIKRPSIWFLNPFKWGDQQKKGISYRDEFKMQYTFKPIFSTDSENIIVSRRNSLRIYNLQKKSHVKKIRGFNKVEFNVDSSILCISNKNHTQIWESNFDSIITEIYNTNYSNKLFSEDGKMLLTTKKDSLFIWNAKLGNLIQSKKSPANDLLMAKFYANDSSILTLCLNNSAYLINSNDFSIVREFSDYGMNYKNKLKGYLDLRQAIFIKKESRKCGYELPWPSNINSFQRKYIVTYNDSIFNIWKGLNGNLIQQIKEYTASQNLIVDRDNKRLISFSEDTNYVKIYNLENVKLPISLKPHNGDVRVNRIFNSNEKSYFLSSTGRDKVVMIDFFTGKIVNEFNQNGVGKIESNGSFFLLESRYEISIYTCDSLKKIRSITCNKYFRGSGILGNKFWITKGPITITRKLDKQKARITGVQLEFNLPRLILRAYTHPFEIFKMSGESSFHVEERNYRTESSIVRSKIAVYRHKSVTCLVLSPDNKYLVTGSSDHSAVVWRKGGRYVTKLIGHELGLICVKFSTDSRLVYTSSYDKTIRIWDAESGKCLNTLNCSSPVTSIEFNTNGQFIVVSYDDGSIGIWDLLKCRELLRSYYFDGDPKKWVHIHSSGLFDASPEAMEMMYWVKGFEVIEFSQLKDRYWLPDLWKKILLSETLPEVSDMQQLKFYPDVTLESTSLEDISINLTKRDGGYGVVKIFLNGKEINPDARGANFNYEALNQIIKINIKNHPYLINGKNEIKVVASSENGIDSRGAVVSILNDTVEFSEPNFYGVIIGIGEYANSSINLKFSVQDAVGISKAITIAANNLFKERSHIYTLTSKDKNLPNKENIKEVFENISKNAKSDDIIFVYLAGHGISTSGEKGDFYFLTSDAKSANNDSYQDEIIRQTSAISSNEFVEWIKKIPALKQVMIIDACGSGKAVDNLVSSRDIEPSQLKAIDRMKDRTGMFIISGCAADAVSYEASQYGQGLLTYSLLQAMKGAALKENKYVDVNTILSFARDEVPKLANGIGGVQTPQLLIPKSGSFDIGILEDSDKIEIPLAKAKTVFVRSSLVESNEDDDILNISALLDDRLSQISARGNASKIVFFDSRMYPQSCKISGGYYKKEDRIYVNLKIRCGELISEHKVEAENLEKLIDNIIKIVEEN